MARYIRDYQGIPGRPEPGRGMDPNYQGGYYRGVRTRGSPGQARYGAYRMGHADEFWGVEQGTRPYRAPQNPTGRNWQGGGVHDWRREPEMLREFNAESPALHPGARQGRYDDFAGPGGEPRVHQARPHPGYANRGLSSGGYSEAWARWPMRGGR